MFRTFSLLHQETSSEYVDVLNDMDKLNSFSYCIVGSFSKTLFGIILFYIVLIVRDFLIIIVEIILCIYSSVLFKKYLRTNFRKSLKNANAQATIDLNEQSQAAVTTTCSPTTYEMSLRKTKSLKVVVETKVIKRVTKYNQKLTTMTIYIIFCSIFFHIGLIQMYFVSYMFFNTMFYHLSILLSCVSFLIKCISNFVLFFKFNKKFNFFISNIFGFFTQKLQRFHAAISNGLDVFLFLFA